MRRAATRSLVVAAGLFFVAGLILPSFRAARDSEIVWAQDAAAPDKAGSSQTTAFAGRQPTGSLPRYRAVAALDQKLSQAVEVDFGEIPLRDAVFNVATQIEADVIFDEAAIQEEGLSSDVSVTLWVQVTPVSARTVLKLMLEPHGLAMVTHAGMLLITTETAAEEYFTLRVYNVRDLADRNWPPLETILGEANEAALDPFRALPWSLPSSASGSKMSNVLMLRMLIMRSTSGEWAMLSGGTGGSIRIYDGQLVVR